MDSRGDQEERVERNVFTERDGNFSFSFSLPKVKSRMIPF